MIAAEISELEAELADSTDSGIARWIRYRLVLLNRELIKARVRESEK